MALSDTDRAVLDFEHQWWTRQEIPYGAKEHAIGADLALTVTHYYRRLAALLGDPDANARHPAMLRCLRERVDQRHILTTGQPRNAFTLMR
jgi:uncharacterized protein DUF3263